jgi:SAM-dependent methyltransferase
MEEQKEDVQPKDDEDDQKEVVLRRRRKPISQNESVDFNLIPPILSLLSIKSNTIIESIRNDPILKSILRTHLQNMYSREMNFKQFWTMIKQKMSQQKYKEQAKKIKALFQSALHSPKRLSQLIDTYIVPTESERENYAEISTPYALRQDMLNQMPSEFWTCPKLVFEPCCGKGGFLLDIVDRFMEGLKYRIPDKEERYKTIVEKCLYFADISPLNIYTCKLLLDPENRYDLRYHEGDTLELDIQKKWGLIGFDAVIGNPPFNQSQKYDDKKGGGDSLWNKFVFMAIQYLNTNGFLLFVHPSGWRKPESARSKNKNMFEMMTKQNQLVYLEIHDSKDGKSVFNAGTRYDWYLLQKTPKYKHTIVIGEDKIQYSIDLSKWPFLPNSNLESIKNLLKTEEDQPCEIMYSASQYETRKKWISKTKTNQFKYPIVHAIPKSGVRWLYSSRNDNGHFGIPKIIFGDNGLNDVVIDLHGEYGMSQHAMAIPIANSNEANQIKAYLLNPEFKQMIKACSWSNFQIDWRLFTYFKKDFWR